MSLTLAHLQPAEVSLDDLRIVIDLWADKEPRTRKNVTVAIRQFWKWVVDEGYRDVSPATRLRYPKIPRRAPDLLPLHVDTQLLAAAEHIRDQLALALLLDLGIRKAELGGVMVRDIDLARRMITVFGKGAKERVLPLRGRVVILSEEFLLTPYVKPERTPEPDDYLLHPQWAKGGTVYNARPKQPMPSQTLHRWWYRHLHAAGLVPDDVERGMNMHRARHTFATELRRDARDIGIVQHMLGHSDIRTTEESYGHYDLSDLEQAMEQFAKARGKDPN
jgi:site-specific recombinase XerD